MQFWSCPGVGHLHPILSPTIGFCMKAQPHRGAFAAFPKKMTNARGDGHAWNWLSHYIWQSQQWSSSRFVSQTLVNYYLVQRYIRHLHTNNSGQSENKLTFKSIILILCCQVDIFRILVAGLQKWKNQIKYHALKTVLRNQLVFDTSDSSSNNTSDPWNYFFTSLACLFHLNLTARATIWLKEI